MKAIAALCCASALLVFAAPTLANEPSSACQAKRRNIEAQLANATEHGRKQEVAGLKKALRANQANCTDASLEKSAAPRSDRRRRRWPSARRACARPSRKATRRSWPSARPSWTRRAVN